MFAWAFALAGCQDYNPNLGAAPQTTSSLSSIAPAAKAAGSPAFNIQVNGAGFVTGSTVTWNNGNQSTNLATNVVSSTELIALVPAAQVANTGTFSIGVISPETGGNQNQGNNISNFLLFCVTSSTNPDCSQNAAARSAMAAAGADHSPAISAGTRYVVFVASSPDLSSAAAGDVNEIFLRDTCQGAAQTTPSPSTSQAACTPQSTLISAGLDGAAPNGASRSPSISADGRFVVFASDASNLAPNDDNSAADIFLRDTCNGAPQDSGCKPTTTRVSVGPGGAEANGASASPSISPDGRYISFESVATNLLPSDVPAGTPVGGTFVRDTCFGATGACTPSTSALTISSGSSGTTAQ